MGSRTYRQRRHQYWQPRLLYHSHWHRQRFFKMFGLGRLTHQLLTGQDTVFKGEDCRVAGRIRVMVWFMDGGNQYLWGRHFYADKEQAGSRYRSENYHSWILQLFWSGHRCQNLLFSVTTTPEEQMDQFGTLRVHRLLQTVQKDKDDRWGDWIVQSWRIEWGERGREGAQWEQLVQT